LTAGIYIHYPFCLKKCNYCDFTSFVTSQKDEDELIQPMIQEIQARSQSRFKEFEYDTIYFGGGTPSLMKPEFINQIFNSLVSDTGFAFSKNLEVTLEANPETVTVERANEWIKAGINRFSIGAQSSDDRVLEQSGRIHSAKKVQEAVQILREAGINNINLDFILGLPGETDSTFQKNLDMISLLGPDHLSIYFLTVNDHTRLYEQITAGEIILPIEEGVVNRWQSYTRSISLMGFDHYEISNFAKPGKQCKHNLHYWHLDPYFAIGCSAVGFDGYIRYTNPKSLEEYREFDFTDTHTDRIEVIDKFQLKQENIMLSLRLLHQGITLEMIDPTKRNIIKKWLEEKYVEQKDNRIFLTEKGVIFSNQVIISLF
jgi:oxygen-independent coproporphyrinogen-3 oxidase